MRDAEVHRAAQAIRSRATGRHLLLLCDFDGTLCEFNPDPAAVWLTPSRRRLLEAIACQGATVGIVSGRRLPDVRMRSALMTDAYYAGLHGLEIEGQLETFHHPDITGSRNLLERIRAELSDRFAQAPGVLIEDKGLSVAAHFREASGADAGRLQAAVEQIARPHLASGRIRTMHGASVIELLPSIAWNKGSAVEWIRDRVHSRRGPTLPVYLGDDVTDEDAFRVVRADGVAVAASTRASGAEFVVDGPPAVESLLAALAGHDPAVTPRPR